MKFIVTVYALCIGLFGAATHAAVSTADPPRITPAATSAASPITAAAPPASLSQLSRQVGTIPALQAAAGTIALGSVGGWITMRRRRPKRHFASPAMTSAPSATRQVLIGEPGSVQAFSLSDFDDLTPSDPQSLLAAQPLVQAGLTVKPSRQKRTKARPAHAAQPRTRHHAVTQWAE